MLNKSNAKEVANLRIHLRTGNPGAYARGMSALHRASSTKQQIAIEAVIAVDGTKQLFKYVRSFIASSNTVAMIAA